jgi:hypothetical protein
MESPKAGLLGVEGELFLVRIGVDARHLEDLLEVLATRSFPINPEILHGAQRTVVEFPAYEARLAEVRTALAEAGFPSDAIRVESMLSAVERL